MPIHVIVEVEGFEGDEGEIIVRNTSSQGLSSPAGAPDRLYCVGSLHDDGVLRFVDWGYATIAQARAAWPDACDAQALPR